MPRKSRPPEKINWFSIFTVIGLPFFGWIGGNLWSGVRIANNLATKPYVEELQKQTVKYTDEKIMQTLKDAYEHSDRNREAMLAQTKEWMTELRLSNVVLSTKLDALTSAIGELKDAHAHDPRSRVDPRSR